MFESNSVRLRNSNQFFNMAVLSAPGAHSSPAVASWRNFDWILLALVLTLSLWGCATVFSASRSNPDLWSRQSVPAASATGDGANATSSTRSNGSSIKSVGGWRSDAGKQIISIVVGLLAMLLVLRLDYQLLMPLQGWIYAGNCALLALLIFLPSNLAPKINGAKSWIHLGSFTVQPSEFCKFAVIVTLAAWLCRRQPRIGEWKIVLQSLLYLALPILLIMRQPDFGTTLSILAIWFGMMFFGGARWQHLLTIVTVGVVVFGAAWQGGVLKEHQKERLAVFLDTNPNSQSQRDAGYQVNQSQIAIGGGGLTGQGFGQGIQSHGGRMPENTTDFVFTVVAEELGFVGASILLMLYLGLLLRSANLAMTTDNYFGVLIAGGFTALIGFHAIVNLGMTMRVMPITGVPLPFFSYGGSSYIAFMLCIGLLQNIALRSRRGN